MNRLVTKWFWEQTEGSEVESEDSKLYRSLLVGEFGKLASYLRVDDKKIVEYLASNYLNKVWTTNGIYDYDFQALTADLKGNWFSANSCRPLVGWHDELRVEFPAKSSAGKIE